MFPNINTNTHIYVSMRKRAKENPERKENHEDGARKKMKTLEIAKKSEQKCNINHGRASKRLFKGDDGKNVAGSLHCRCRQIHNSIAIQYVQNASSLWWFPVFISIFPVGVAIAAAVHITYRFAHSLFICSISLYHKSYPNNVNEFQVLAGLHEWRKFVSLAKRSFLLLWSTY